MTGPTPLDELINALYGRDTTKAISLIDSGVPVDEPDGKGTTALYLAAVQGLTEVVRHLLSRGADPNREALGDSEGTPLCASAAWGYVDIVRALLDHGADPNQIENQDETGGMTALKWARQNKHFDTVQVLIERGAVDR